MVKSYIKLYGPSMTKALHALEKVALEMPDCSIWHVIMAPNLPYQAIEDEAFITFYSSLGAPEIPKERVHKMISKSGDTIGEYDFFFEWHVEPSKDQILTLIEKIDNALKDTGCMYTIVTR